jgi:hypothetical protein
MNINKIRSFYQESITEGWTKKDWALNLLPLGGIISVAYEIGSACLSNRDHPAKISQDFFKSPIRTSLKKIAQCLWVPIVICGALKLVSLIVNACWDRCFPPANNRPKKESQVIDPLAKNPCEIIPGDVVISNIFSYLNLHELAVCRSISKRWNTLVSTPNLWKSAIYREIAFSSENWFKWNEDMIKDVDFSKEYLSLPDNIVEELRRSHQVATHVLVRIPKGLTIKKLGELAKKHFPNNDKGYSFIENSIFNELGDKPVDESVWVLMTTQEIDRTRKKKYKAQKRIIDKLAKTTGIPYEVPSTLTAAACIIAAACIVEQHPNSKKFLFSDNPMKYTRCQENINGYQVAVGGFSPRYGLQINCYTNDFNYIGAVAVRKF